jgi:alkylation response protein AidB-like acyl-CoA dehydrogenase
MDLDQFTQQARSWLSDHRDAAPPDYGAICPPDRIAEGIAWQQLLAAEGWAGLHWPVEHGGRGLTVAHTGIWMTECARVGVPPVLNMVGLVLTGGSLMAYGTPEQQATHLRATLHAQHVWCQLFSEPGAGSDLAGLSTTAERDGDTFVVNGQKVWCSGGRYSNWGILMARTDRSLPKHKGISFFLLDMSLPGIELRPLKQMTGEAEFDEVFFTDVVVPSNTLLGPLNGGWGVGMSVLTNERGHIGASVIGLERRLAKIASMGTAGALDALDRQAVTELWSRGKAMAAMGSRQGPTASIGGSLMKLGITEMMFDSAMLQGSLAGADAMVDGAGTHTLLAAPGGRIAGGSSQVQRNLIGERILGLPKEPSGS